jgi:ketosteroid isomerase-like protein
VEDVMRVIAAVVLAASLTPAFAEDSDRTAIQDVVRAAYVEGVHVKGDPALMRKGFHPEFRMYALRDGALSVVTLDEWAARIEKGARERQGAAPEVKHEFALVDRSGNAAVARVELHKGGKHVFTDYLSLYRFAEGWKIVSKTFQPH